MDFQETTEDKEIDVDSLLKEIDSPQPSRPMSSETEGQVAAPQPQAAPTPQPAQFEGYEWDYKGKKIQVPYKDPRATQWLQQGYDYSQKMAAFNEEKARIEEQAKAYEKYKTIDEYVKKDPEWWKHVEEQYNNRLASEDPVVLRVKGMLEEQLTPFKQILAEKEQKEIEARNSQADQALATEMKSIREKYSDLDFDTPDAADGKSLEYKVLEHGAKHNFPSFKAAFLDFYHEQLEKMWESRGREAISKDAQKKQKLGLSATPTPSKKSGAEDFDIRGKSYNDILNDIMSQL